MTSDELENFDGDSLLHSLLLVSKHFGINTNAESLTASLPLVDDKLTPELFAQDYGSEQVSDNEVAVADSPSVINVLDSILGTIENNLVYDF